PWRDVGPHTPLGGEGSDPVRIIATVGEQHCARFQAGKEFAYESVVVRLARCECDPHRQAISVDYHMYLAGKAATRPAHGLPTVAGDASGVLVNADNRGVDHLNGSIMSSSKCGHGPAPYARGGSK